MQWLQTRGADLRRTRLLLTNDSCFGPYRSIADIIAAFDGEAPEQRIVFGISDSHEYGRHHLQSYWLYFRPERDFAGRRLPRTAGASGDSTRRGGSGQVN